MDILAYNIIKTIIKAIKITIIHQIWLRLAPITN